MSDNYRLYVEKMAELRTARATNRPLNGRLEELLGVVRKCEEMWALEERLERS